MTNLLVIKKKITFIQKHRQCLEGIMFHKISRTEKEKYYMISLTCGI